MRSANKQLVVICTAVVLLLTGAGNASAAWSTRDLTLDTPAAYRPGAVLVRFRPAANETSRHRLLVSLDANPSYEIAGLDVWVLSVPQGREKATVQALSLDPLVYYADLDYVAHALQLPDDPYLDQQWPLPTIEAPAAWDLTVGGAEQVVAIVDSGIDLDHPDLASKLWINSDEVPDNGLDDDHNGYVDDVYGCHFYDRWDSGQGQRVDVQDGDVQDSYGHGSHVAGIAAAATNNGVGIAGLSWGAQLLAVRVLNEYGEGHYSHIAAGIVYAATQGATVINLSLGGESPSQVLQDAVDEAHARGAVVVAAAGNSGGPVLYPAAYQHVIAVAATDQADQRWYDSSRGPEVDLAAPGVNVTSATIGAGYEPQKGTSVAAPHVSGLAALVLSLQPWLEPQAVQTLLEESADDVNVATFPGWDESLGWGRINARQAVQAAAQGLVLSLSAEPDWLPASGGQAQIIARLSGEGGEMSGGGAVIALSAGAGAIAPDVAVTTAGLATATLDAPAGPPGGSVAITATFGSAVRSLLVPYIEVTATPTATPTCTPTVSATPSPTATPTASPSPTMTPTPTATRSLGWHYLPLLMR
jgi:thermitase